MKVERSGEERREKYMRKSQIYLIYLKYTTNPKDPQRQKRTETIKTRNTKRDLNHNTVHDETEISADKRETESHENGKRESMIHNEERKRKEKERNKRMCSMHD